MSERKIDRRSVLKAAMAIAAAGFTPGRLFAQVGRFTALDHAEVLQVAAESAAALRARANWT